jgi:hypothetical protein
MFELENPRLLSNSWHNYPMCAAKPLASNRYAREPALYTSPKQPGENSTYV